jgi:hypothetical protein
MVDVNAGRTWLLAGSAEGSTDPKYPGLPRFAIGVPALAVYTSSTKESRDLQVPTGHDKDAFQKNVYNSLV